jgi:hypothetical protein
MKKVIGSELNVYLKSSMTTIIADIYGLLVDVDEESIYVQGFNVENPELFIVPKDNIKYCKTTMMPSANLTVDVPEQPKNKEPDHVIVQEQPPAAKPVDPYLNVFINEEQVARIPVPPTFNLSEWNDNILRVVMGNPDVKSLLANKVQQSISYWPGEVYIEVSEETVEEPMPQDNDEQNSFSMGGDIAQQFLNPSQMVMRLNSVTKKGKKNGETKM